jgi:hypothetical protein
MIEIIDSDVRFEEGVGDSPRSSSPTRITTSLKIKPVEPDSGSVTNFGHGPKPRLNSKPWNPKSL